MVISGFQNGADIAAIIAAKMYNIPTGGYMPLGYITESGPRPEYAQLYGAKEHFSPKYSGRTFLNCEKSDGTIIMATDFNSPGTKLTFTAIHQYKKPSININMSSDIGIPYSEVIDWIEKYNIKIINVAGNRESVSNGITGNVVSYLCGLFDKMGFKKI